MQTDGQNVPCVQRSAIHRVDIEWGHLATQESKHLRRIQIFVTSHLKGVKIDRMCLNESGRQGSKQSSQIALFLPPCAY